MTCDTKEFRSLLSRYLHTLADEHAVALANIMAHVKGLLLAARADGLLEAENFARCYDLGTPESHAIADGIRDIATRPAPSAAPARETRQGKVTSATPGMGIVELKIEGSVPEWLDPGYPVLVTSLASLGGCAQAASTVIGDGHTPAGLAAAREHNEVFSSCVRAEAAPAACEACGGSEKLREVGEYSSVLCDECINPGTQAARVSRAQDLRAAAKLVLDRYDELRPSDRVPAAEFEILRAAITAYPVLSTGAKQRWRAPNGWTVERVGDAMHIRREDGKWCGYMVENGPAAALTHGFLSDLLSAQSAPSYAPARPDLSDDKKAQGEIMLGMQVAADQLELIAAGHALGKNYDLDGVKVTASIKHAKQMAAYALTRLQPARDTANRLFRSSLSHQGTAPTQPTYSQPGSESATLIARVWKRDSTQEWVLEIEGTINDQFMICRHTEPLSTAIEDVPGLPSHYLDTLPQAEHLMPDEALESLMHKHALIGVAGDNPNWEAKLIGFARGAIDAAFGALARAPSGQEGMPVTQEPKYGIRSNRIYNRASGEFIPADEPVFIFRGRDSEAVKTLEHYMDLFGPSEHRAALEARVHDFRTFAAAHPNRMKAPDTMYVGRQDNA